MEGPSGETKVLRTDRSSAFMEKTIFAILTLLDTQLNPLNSADIAGHLRSRGIELSERTVRHYLKMLETKGYTTGEKKRGRKLTERGRQELHEGFVAERVGFAISRINNLSFRCDIDIDTLKGTVVLNVAYLPEDKARLALSVLQPVLNSPYSMTRRMIIAGGGEKLGDLTVPTGFVGIGTVCSVTVNSIFLKAGIPIYSRLGGLVEVIDHHPARFVSAISYESSSVPPLELFMKSRMTDVLGAVSNGKGTILGSFREIPEASLGDARRLNEKMKQKGFSGIIVFGRPGEHLLNIPVMPDKAGVVVLGGLNPIAALEEAQIPTESRAMATLTEYETLSPSEDFQWVRETRHPDIPVLMEHLDVRKAQDSRHYWSIFSAMQQTTL